MYPIKELPQGLKQFFTDGFPQKMPDFPEGHRVVICHYRYKTDRGPVYMVCQSLDDMKKCYLECVNTDIEAIYWYTSS